MDQGEQAVAESTSRWSRPAGYRDIIVVSIPLVLSTSSWTIQHFVDRMFLAWHDPLAMAAAMPAGLLAFTFICFFMGTAGYVNVFVAQYHGAGRPRRVGPALWQGIWFSLASGAILPLLALTSGPIFRWAGHSEALQELEGTYFRIMMLGGVVTVYNNALTSFFTGLGRNWPVFWVNVALTVVNLLFSYAMIFGNWGFPAWGIAGAAWATVIGQTAGAILFSVLVFAGRHERDFSTRSGWRIDLPILRRLMRFGLPSGAQFLVDILAFTFFAIIVGRIGEAELAATNLAFQINMLAFMPLVGAGIAVQALVGQWLGRERPDLAARATWSSFQICYIYMLFFAALYLLVPGIFIDPFMVRADAATIDTLRPMAIAILRFVAIYCLFDTMTVIMASALKGAGDTRFVMWYAFALGWSLMVAPSWIAVQYFDAGITTVWVFLTIYVSLVALGFLARFVQGRWRSMRVIEPAVAPMPADLPDAPLPEI